jgi:murein DD-endopeptidase MepM/ murein hydrolase activator NlpD
MFQPTPHYVFASAPQDGLSLRTRVALAVGVVLALGAVTAFGVAPATRVELPPLQTVVEPVVSQAGDTVKATLNVPAVFEPQRFRQIEQISRGETLSSLLSRLGATDPEFIRFAVNDKTAKRLLQLRAGRSVSAEVDEDVLVHRLTYRFGTLEESARRPVQLVIERVEGKLRASEAKIEVEESIEAAATEIRTTLFAATDSAGIPETIASRVADILSGDLDLRRDLRRGAKLSVVYEMIREAGTLEASVPGRVLAVELINGNKRHEAVWFEHEVGKGAYYTFSGQSLTKSFLREPLEFTRITSGFSRSRLHPLFNVNRAHTGVDFAAPVGTKVRAVGDGVIDFAASDGGYGRKVVISHRNRVSTVYAHLQGFAEGIKPGARVSQGDVIGYVGMTGWTTGPHLHYEFRINGKHTDPLRAVLPEGRKLSAAELKQFKPLAEGLLERIAQIDSTQPVARFE